MTLHPFASAATDGDPLWHMGALLNFKATGEDTDGQFWLAEQLSPPGYSSPLHRHTREDELFIVLDGQMSVQVGDDTHKAVGGSLVFAPRGLPHQFHVESPETRFLILSTPAGFEKWFQETGEPADGLVLPPPMEGVPDIGKLISSLARYGVEMLGGPSGPEDTGPRGR
ncbi:quercetin 2,3-dioxygenase [Streptomyces sp. NPDC049954]|uniref:quercetin 2,3-dioxygenase n=1 Tax=Streptomyces sp. NPDC049954 TaxID=3155779 RepID=UPI0034270AC6